MLNRNFLINRVRSRLCMTRPNLACQLKCPTAPSLKNFYSSEKKESISEGNEGERDEVAAKGGSGFAWMAGLLGFTSAMIYYLGQPEEGTSSDDGVLGYPKRALSKFTGVFRTFKEPAFEKLLPDQVVDPAHPRPYTLVIDLDKFLVCHMWDPQQSRWRIAKRPGAELFLFYAAQLYEVVVFSSLPQHEGDAIVKKLDPFGCISHSLFRFATTHSDSGLYLKDLSKINRDLSKVIVMGHDKKGFSLQPENFIQMREWTGGDKDTSLEQSIDYLEGLAFSRLSDVRPAIRYHNERIFPEDFESDQAKSFEEARTANLQTLARRHDNFFFRLFGLAKSASVLEKENPTYWEKKEQRMEMRRKEFNHLKELMLKQMTEEMEKEKAFYAEHKMALWDLFSKGPAAPKP